MLDDILYVVISQNNRPARIDSLWRTKGQAQGRLNVIFNDTNEHSTLTAVWHEDELQQKTDANIVICTYTIRKMTVFELLHLALQGREIK